MPRETERVLNESRRKERRLTFSCFMVAARYRHIRDADERERPCISAREIFVEPRASLNIAHSTTHIVASLEEFVDNMTTNETIHTGDEDGCARRDGHVRFRHLACWLGLLK